MKPLVSILLFAGLAACSGSGGSPSSSGSGAPPQTVLLLDPAAGSEDALQGRLLAVALERPDGSFSANLLEREVVVPVADPLGTPVVVGLRDLPAGDYVAARLLFARGSFELRGSDGRRGEVELERDDHRVLFEDAHRHRSGTRDWLELRHRSGLQLVRGSGPALWRADFAGRSGSALGVQGFRATVMAKDEAARTVDALARVATGSASVPVRLQIADGALLVSDGERRVLTVAEFFARLTPGRELRVQGTLDASFTVRVTAAEVDDRSQHGGSGENEVFGRIETVGAGGRFTLQVLAVVRGAPAPAVLPLVTVDAGSAFVHHGGGDHRALGFETLRAGMLVEVEWNGPFAQDPVRAREVEIERDGGGAAQPELEGAVGGVDVAEGVITVVPRRDDPLVVGGRVVRSARVLVTAGTWLFRDDAIRASIGIGQVRIGERVWVRGTVRADGSVQAAWVRVRDER